MKTWGDRTVSHWPKQGITFGQLSANLRTRGWSDCLVDMAHIWILRSFIDSRDIGESVGWQWASTTCRRRTAGTSWTVDLVDIQKHVTIYALSRPKPERGQNYDSPTHSWYVSSKSANNDGFSRCKRVSQVYSNSRRTNPCCKNGACSEICLNEKVLQNRALF